MKLSLSFIIPKNVYCQVSAPACEEDKKCITMQTGFGNSKTLHQASHKHRNFPVIEKVIDITYPSSILSHLKLN